MTRGERALARTSISLFISMCALSASGCGSDVSPSESNPSPSQAPGQSPQSVTVAIPTGATGKGSAAYGTNPLVVSPGTTVNWVNQDSMPHTATSTGGVWDSGAIAPGQSYSFRFNNTGTFPYFCSIHGINSMSGTIQVSASAPAPSPSATPRSGTGRIR